MLRWGKSGRVLGSDVFEAWWMWGMEDMGGYNSGKLYIRFVTCQII